MQHPTAVPPDRPFDPFDPWALASQHRQQSVPGRTPPRVSYSLVLCLGGPRLLTTPHSNHCHAPSNSLGRRVGRDEAGRDVRSGVAGVRAEDGGRQGQVSPSPDCAGAISRAPPAEAASQPVSCQQPTSKPAMVAVPVAVQASPAEGKMTVYYPDLRCVVHPCVCPVADSRQAVPRGIAHGSCELLSSRSTCIRMD